MGTKDEKKLAINDVRVSTARVSSSFDDDDDETIVYGSNVPSDFSADDDDSDSTTRDNPRAATSRHADFDDFDEDETQLLPDGEAQSLASSEDRSSPRLRARTGARAKPLGPEGSVRSSLPPRIGADNAEEDTLNMAVPKEILSDLPRPRKLPPARKLQHNIGHRPSLVDEVTPVPTSGRVRSLSSLPPPDIDLSDQTMSSPNIVRMSFQPAGGAKKETHNPTHADVVQQTSTMGSAEAHTMGRLVVEAPDDATVYVDGVERGKGRVEVDDLDRFTHYIVRVHRTQYRPWSASVSLSGEVEAKVVPELVRR